MDAKTWAQDEMTRELDAAREAPNVASRARHEGRAAIFAHRCGDWRRFAAMTLGFVAYPESRRRRAMDGMAEGLAMVRGVSSYLTAMGDEHAAEWERDGAGTGTDG
jgi:hypothetical protein